MKKRIVCMLLTVCLLLSVLTVGASAAAPDTVAEKLKAINVFRGTNNGFELDRAPTRREAAVMLVRLYGAEEEAKEEFAAAGACHPFTDVKDWSEPYINWLYAHGLTNGMSADKFGADRFCTVKEYATFLLRALGYRDNMEFTYAEALTTAKAAGFYQEDLFSGLFLRGDLAIMTYLALGCDTIGAPGTLLDALVQVGAISSADAKPLKKIYQDGLPLSFTADGAVLNEKVWNKVDSKFELHIEFCGIDPSLPSGEAVLNKNDIKNLFTSEDGGLLLDTDTLDELAAEWDAAYVTEEMPYIFNSYVKGPTPIDFLKVQYTIDRQNVLKHLMQHILLGEGGTVISPLCAYNANGALFDLTKTYVEVDIDNQQLTYFKNGQLIVNTDVVTGKPDGHQTPTGLYYAHHKETDCTLSGADYSVFVKYWVSVIDDRIGLHDASWRWQFGGNIYVSNGSHGCVNIPESAMVKIFNNIDDGTPVLIHSSSR